MNPIFEELASSYPDVLFLVVDVDELKVLSIYLFIFPLVSQKKQEFAYFNLCNESPSKQFKVMLEEMLNGGILLVSFLILGPSCIGRDW